MSGNPASKGKKKAWKPSSEAKKLLAETAGKLITLPHGERQWVLQNLRIFDATKKKQPNKAKKAKSKKELPKKSDWKKEWQNTAAYKAWQAAFTPEGDPSREDPETLKKFMDLRDSAFRSRDTIKAKWSETKTAEESESKAPDPDAAPKGADAVANQAIQAVSGGGKIHIRKDFLASLGKEAEDRRARKAGKRRKQLIQAP